MRITPLNRGAVADTSDSVDSMFYIDNNGKYHIGRNSAVNDIKDLVGAGFFLSMSDEPSHVKAAFGYAKDIYPSGFGGTKSVAIIDKLLETGHFPFVKIKLGVVNRDVFSYLPAFSDNNLVSMLPAIRKLVEAGAVGINFSNQYIYSTINNENFESLFGVPVPAGEDMPFSIQHLNAVSEFLCTEFREKRLSYTALAILNEFKQSLSEMSINTMYSLIPAADAEIIKEGFSKLPMALARAEHNKLYDLLIDLSESVRSTGHIVNSYRNIFSPDQFNAIAEKYIAFPLNYHSAASFSDVVEVVSSTSTALIYTRKLYSYLYNMLTTGDYTQPVGFLGVVTSLNTNYLANLIPAEFLATMVSEITKQRSSIPNAKCSNTAQYILLILDALNEEGDYDLMYSRVATLASMAMAAIREEEVTGIYSALKSTTTEPLTLLNDTSYIDRLDSYGVLAGIHQKIYHAEGFEALLRTLDVATPNAELESEEYTNKMRATKEFLSMLSVMGDKHLSPVSAVLKYGDITPETILRLQRNFVTKPTLLATFMEETLLFVRQDTVMAHPVYKHICDFNLLRDASSRYFSDFDFTLMAGSMHFFMHVPELWVLMMLQWFATPATYEYLAIPKEPIEAYLPIRLSAITTEIRLMAEEIFSAPLMNVASYLDPVVAFYKSKYDVWDEEEDAVSLEPRIMIAAVEDSERGSLPDFQPESGNDEGNNTTAPSESD